MKSPALEFEQVRYAYPDGTEALRGLSLTVNQGETVGIVGPNGAGKTTALFAACGLLETDGNVSIQGKRLTKQNAKSVRRRIGFVFQNPDDQLFMPTVYEDIAFGPKNLGSSKEEVRESVRRALDNVELPGYEEKSSHHLSSGEKKRIALATVLSMNPEVLILDEPSTNLDPHSRRRIIHLLDAMPKTKIIAGHDLELLLDLCDRAIIINHGVAVAAGHPRQLFADAHLMESNLLEVPYSLQK